MDKRISLREARLLALKAGEDDEQKRLGFVEQEAKETFDYIEDIAILDRYEAALKRILETPGLSEQEIKQIAEEALQGE